MRLSHILIAGAVASATQVAPLPAQTVDNAPRPSRGKRVDIGGGQRLYLDCRGKGSPTVILEAGAGDLSFVWALVQDRIAELTTVCSYDRGGYLWSDPGAATERLAPSAGPQLIGYLRATTYQVGVLLHFGVHPKFYRFVDSSKIK
jgi:hypothetical protein